MSFPAAVQHLKSFQRCLKISQLGAEHRAQRAAGSVTYQPILRERLAARFCIMKSLKHSGKTGRVPCPPLYSVEDDAALQNMLAAAEKIYVVIVRTPRKQLIRQLSDRSALIHLPVRVRDKATRFAPMIERLEKALPNWMSANACRIMGRRWAHRSRIRERNERLCKLYSPDGALDAIHEHWETSLKKACGDRLQQPFLYVEPGPRAASRKTFRLAAGTRSATIAASPINWALILLPLVLSQPILEFLEIC